MLRSEADEHGLSVPAVELDRPMQMRRRPATDRRGGRQSGGRLVHPLPWVVGISADERVTPRAGRSPQGTAQLMRADAGPEQVLTPMGTEG